jgi:hypothetical protein
MLRCVALVRTDVSLRLLHRCENLKSYIEICCLLLVHFQQMTRVKSVVIFRPFSLSR